MGDSNVKRYWVRLLLAFAIFIASTVGTGYVLGRVAVVLTPKSRPAKFGVALTPEDEALDSMYFEQAKSHIQPGPTMYSFLLGAALGGVFGIVAGRELLRKP
jgi:hypothetical protein